MSASRFQDSAAERAVLAAVLLDGERREGALERVRAIVRDRASWHDPRHAEIFDAMTSVADRGEDVDVITVSTELRARSRLNSIGGPSYLGSLTDEIPTIAHVDSHARIVADMAAGRRLTDLARELLEREKTGVSPEDLIRLASSSVEAISSDRPSTKSGPRPILDFVVVVFEQIEAIASGLSGRVSGTTTGYRDLDQLTGGRHPGSLNIVAARPSMGKTSFGVGSLAKAAEAEIAKARAEGRLPRWSLIFSLEMPGRDLALRLICSKARVDSSAVRDGFLTQDMVDALTMAANHVAGLPLLIDDNGDTLLDEIVSKSSAVARTKEGLHEVLVDYLQLVQVRRSSSGSETSREGDVGAISRGLKGLAKRLDIPVTALSQLNRKCEERADKRPMMSDIRESGAVEQDADVVLFIYRDEMYRRDSEDRGIAEIIVAKQRNGAVGDVKLRFVRELTLFEDLAQEEPPRYEGAQQETEYE